MQFKPIKAFKELYVVINVSLIFTTMILPDLVIAPSNKGGKGGKGVFTTKAFKVGTIVEISPVLVFTGKEYLHLAETMLYNYVFEWGPTRKKAALALGYISMYNHCYSANCEYEMDFDNNLMTIKVVKPIKKGEELYINYNAEADNKNKVWFDAK